jgi:hypothetical protein
MNRHDAPRFAATITALAVATRGELDDAIIELYYRALEDVPMDLLEAGAVELAKRAEFFPRPAEWRLAVDRLLELQQRLIATGQVRLLPAGDEEYVCAFCENTGWVQTWFECKRHICRPKDSQAESVHTHQGVTPCSEERCLERRARLRTQRRRYGKRAS